MEDKNGISDNLVVHCPTEDITRKVLKCFHDLGYIWRDGSSCFEGENYWKTYRYNTCFTPFRGRIGCIDLRNLRGYKIMSGEYFVNNYSVTRTEDNSNTIKLKKLYRIKLKFTL